MTYENDPTHSTYQKHAVELAEWFAGIGPRDEDIDRAFDLSGAGSDARIVELGCGDGRDSLAIRAHTSNYTGVDYSSEALAIARQKHPDFADAFVEGDMTNYPLGEDIDIIFAFVSFLHLSRDELAETAIRCLDALRPGGVVALSMKSAEAYTENMQEDRFGKRMFYMYHPDEVSRMFANQCDEVYRREYDHHGKQWFVLMFQKP